MALKKSVKQSPARLIIERAGRSNDSDGWKDSCSGPTAALSRLQRDQNVNEFLDTSGWSLFYLQAKYFLNWQQLGIYNRGIKKRKEKKKKEPQKLRIRLFI